MINCEKERVPENGIEKLITRTCVVSGGEVRCGDSCPKVYKQGRVIPQEEFYKYGVENCILAIPAGTPLAQLTALV